MAWPTVMQSFIKIHPMHTVWHANTQSKYTGAITHAPTDQF